MVSWLWQCAHKDKTKRYVKGLFGNYRYRHLKIFIAIPRRPGVHDTNCLDIAKLDMFGTLEGKGQERSDLEKVWETGMVLVEELGPLV